MKTIAKNRVAKFAPRIRNIRSYTLENGFTGQPVLDESAASTSLSTLGRNSASTPGP